MPKKKRNPTRPGRSQAPAPPKLLVADLIKARSLMDRGRPTEALETLRALDQVYPNRTEVLLPLADLYFELHALPQYLAAVERLSRLEPNDPEITLALAGAHMLNLRPALALTTFRRFLDRWPRHERAQDVREKLPEMESVVSEMLASTGLTGDDALELATLHEEGQGLLQQGRYAPARRVELELLRRKPDFVPGLNNLSLLYCIEGDLEKAIEASERVLSLHPDNHHALANLTHYLCVSGRLEESQKMAERLRAIHSDLEDLSAKKAEAFSYLGDDEAVLEAFREAGLSAQDRSLPADALLYHLAAVASLRLGDEPQARRYWKQAQECDSAMVLVQYNLDDLAKPVGERHAPWAFGFPQWVPHEALRDLARRVETAGRRHGEQPLQEVVRRYLAEHLQVAGLVPILLDRGDPPAREFGLSVALMARTPAMLEALRDFALSRRGPDSMRSEAARAAAKAGLIPSGPVRLWLQGEWRETLLIGWELHDEPITHHSRRVEDWLMDADEAFNQRDNERAGQLLDRALAAEPDAPDLLYNRAVAYGRQGRTAEANATMDRLSERHPDYLFARTRMAELFVREGDLQRAKELLQPLLSRERLHFSEFSALCSAYIELYLAERNRDAAESWLNMWAGAEPDDPAIPHWRRRLGRGS